MQDTVNPSLAEPTDAMTATLHLLQRVGLWLLPFLAPNAYVWLAWQPTDAPLVLGPYFKYIIYHLYFPALALALFVTVFRLLTESDYRAGFLETARCVILRPLGLFWFVLALLAFAGILWSPWRPLTVYGACVLLATLAAALLVADFTRRGERSGVLTSLTLAGVFQGALAIAQSINGGAVGLRFIGEPSYNPLFEFGVADETYRATGLAFHPNVMGGFLLLALFAAITWAWLVRERRALLVSGILAALVILGGLLATQSRTALMGAIVAGGLTVFLLPDPRRLPRRAQWLLAGVVLVGLVALVVGGIFAYQLPVPRSIIDRMWLVLKNPLARTDRLFYAFPPTVAVIQENPLLGIGANALMLRAVELMPMYSPWLPAHNVYVVVTAEHGLIGGVLFGLACLMTLRGLLRRRQPVVFLMAAAFAGAMLVMLFDHYFWWDDRSFLVLMLLVGVLWGAWLRPRP